MPRRSTSSRLALGIATPIDPGPPGDARDPVRQRGTRRPPRRSPRPASETGLVADVVERLPADIAVLIIDHDMDLVFRLARRITVMVEGRILVEGPPEAIAGDARVRQVYLGERDQR